MKFQWVKGDHFQRARLLIRRNGDWWRVYRFGREEYPLFSERNQGEYNIPKHWHYYFGGRLSIWKP